MALFRSDSVDAPTLEVTSQMIGNPIEEARFQLESAIETHFDAVHRPLSRFDVDEKFNPAEFDDPTSIRDVAYDSDSECYEAERLIRIGEIGEGMKTITITDLPIYHKRRNNIFGMSYLAGDISLVTTAEFYEDGQWTDQSSEWMRNEVIKLMGQMLGVADCTTEGCVMQYTGNKQALSELDEYICGECCETIGEEHLR
ncbi:hypothetical protein [Halorhabdus sp. BNX81]|uniref:hypothetical protein n=1 Tax=Halorhabdus sp. BNX81 TaxID=2980181 RepID=UPI0023DD14CF|nr:hypothetical protein [Halorhabdus sp. BNX81]